MLSIKNSYNYETQYNGEPNIIPFTGNYEDMGDYKFIYIYINTVGNDTLTINFTNKQSDTGYEASEIYNINNIVRELVIPKKLKYFKAMITTDNFSVYDKRIYNVYLSDTQYITSTGAVTVNNTGFKMLDTDGSAITSTGNRLNTNGIISDSTGNKVTTTTNSGKIGLDINVSNTTVPVSGTVSANISGSISNTGFKMLDTDGNSLSSANPLITSENSYNLHRDAFNRLRTSHPYTLFDAKNINKASDKFSNYPTDGSGITYNINASNVSLSCSNSLPRIIRESKCRFPYQPGKSLLILNTFVFGSITGNSSPNSQVSTSTQRVGYFDDYNGIYLQAAPAPDGIKICKINSVSGNTILTGVHISTWNGDPTAKALDFSKAHIFWIDIEWLGVGSVRTGFVLNGRFILAHTFNHANIEDNTYMTSSQLPIRYEITYNTGNATLKQICSTVISEGGYEATSIVRFVGSNSRNTLLETFTLMNVDKYACAIRIIKPGSYDVYNSIIILHQLSIYLNNQQGNNAAKFPVVEYKLILNPLEGAYTWTPYSSPPYSDSYSVIEYALNTDISGITTNSGIIIHSGFLEGKSTINLDATKNFIFQLGRKITGISNNFLQYESDILVLAFKPLYLDDSAPIVNIGYKLGWYEL